MVYSGAWEKLIHEKPEVEDLVELSLNSYTCYWLNMGNI
jgi:hypothetical protein